MKLLLLWLGFIIGNFIYQSVVEQRWGLAIDRSFFQGVALAGVWILGAIR